MSTSELPLIRNDLRAQTRGLLRARIITGDLSPGNLYTIGAFAEQLGVSATPVREALGDLAHVGLVEVIRNRGFRVRALTDDDLDEIMQLRLFLEVPAVVAVTGTLSDAEIRACRELVARCLAAAREGDLILFLEADREFHLRLLEGLRNGRLIRILGQLRDETRLYGLKELAATNRLVPSAREHVALLEAVGGGDVKRARYVITKHLRHTRGSWAGRREH